MKFFNKHNDNRLRHILILTTIYICIINNSSTVYKTRKENRQVDHTTSLEYTEDLLFRYQKCLLLLCTKSQLGRVSILM